MSTITYWVVTCLMTEYSPDPEKNYRQVVHRTHTVFFDKATAETYAEETWQRLSKDNEYSDSGTWRKPTVTENKMDSRQMTFQSLPMIFTPKPKACEHCKRPYN